jgi:hypothetical protein
MVGVASVDEYTTPRPVTAAPPSDVMLPPRVAEDAAMEEAAEVARPGVVMPVPWMLKLQGFSSPSLLAMERVAERVPVAEGSKVIWKVVDPPAAMEFDGIAVTLKSAGCEASDDAYCQTG